MRRLWHTRNIPQRIIENRYAKLRLDERHVEVIPYPPPDEQVGVIKNALLSFDPDYNENYKSKAQLKKMPLIEAFFGCPVHCRMTEFTVEYRVCDIANCVLCKRIGRSVRTPDIEVNGFNLRKEVLRFLTLPIPNKDNPDQFLSSSNARKYAETNKLSADDLCKIIPTKKHTTSSKEKEALKRYKDEDKKYKFDATKVRTTATCNSCGGTRCIFSKKAVGGSGEGIPSAEDLQLLEQHFDCNGFIYTKVSGEAKEMFIESWKYNNTGLVYMIQDATGDLQENVDHKEMELEYSFQH